MEERRKYAFTILQRKSIVLRLCHSLRPSPSKSRSILFIIITLQIDVCATASMQIGIINQVNAVEWNQWMLSLFPIWEKQRIAHWHITRGMLRDSLQLAHVSMSNNDISIQWLIIVFRLDNDRGD